ncbi:MAG TPA: hypothetical protein VFX49_01515 [Chloroflexota bacterium]|nr:hypothetical protein [Chloroflexota bacterium]
MVIEVHEEAGARLGSVALLGYHLIRVLAPKPHGYRYPHPDSYMLVYWARVAALDAFAVNAESRERALLAPNEARALPWMASNEQLYALAFGAALGVPEDDLHEPARLP